MTRAGKRAQPGQGGEEETAKKSFFFSGVSNAEGEILWGYGQWCGLLYSRGDAGSPHSVAIHRNQKFDRVIERRSWPQNVAIYLQVPPVQRASDAIEDKSHAPFRSLDAHLHEALKEGRVVKVEDWDRGGRWQPRWGPPAPPLEPAPPAGATRQLRYKPRWQCRWPAPPEEAH